MILSTLNDWDTALFWWINSHHCPPIDWVMWVASQGWFHAIVILFSILYVLHRKGWNQWWLVVLGIALCFLFADRISVMAFKDGVMRLRPCHAWDGVRMFHTTCGGQYGFVSSHAANCFSVALFLSLFASRKELKNKSMKLLPVLLISWAVLVGYSRPYLGKHYPGDVICGALLGLGVGALVYFLVCQLQKHLQNHKNISTPL